jgi:CRP/FNR family cyclic AMP-dependent transcriptional regulator
MNVREATVLLQAWQSLSRGAADSKDWARVLADFSLFSGVRRRRLRKLVSAATFLELARGEAIGDAPGGSIYIILGGGARTLGASPTRTLTIGDYYGDLSAVGIRARSATLVATEELHVLRLPRTSVLRLARQEPAVSLAIIGDLCARLRRLELEIARA